MDPSSTGWLCETSLFYAAPEVVFPRVVLKKKPDEVPWDRRSDIWSLAVAVSGLFTPTLIRPSTDDTTQFNFDTASYTISSERRVSSNE
jgi:hypothetical protein